MELPLPVPSCLLFFPRISDVPCSLFFALDFMFARVITWKCGFFACRKKLEDSTRCSLCSRHWNTHQEEFQVRKVTTVIIQNLGFSQILWSVYFLSKSLNNTWSWNECIWQTSKLRSPFFWKKVLDNLLSNGKIELGKEELIEFLR